LVFWAYLELDPLEAVAIDAVLLLFECPFHYSMVIS
jgi:hypothetical protein